MTFVRKFRVPKDQHAKFNAAHPGEKPALQTELGITFTPSYPNDHEVEVSIEGPNEEVVEAALKSLAAKFGGELPATSA